MTSAAFAMLDPRDAVSVYQSLVEDGQSARAELLKGDYLSQRPNVSADIFRVLPEKKISETADGASVVAVGANGRMILEGGNLTISRKGTGLLTLMNQGLQGDKTIPLRNVTAVQLKEPGFARGYLRLSINGRDPVGGALEAVRDENAVLFDAPAIPQFKRMRDAIYAAIDAASTPSVPVIHSTADEIEKLASLMERGFLTQGEFTAKKRDLLGL